MGTATAGLIEYAGDTDWFQVSLTAGVDYDFFTSGLANNMDSVLRLIDTDGTTVLGENDDFAPGDPASRLPYIPTVDGDYYVSIVHKDPAATSGDYEVRYLIAAGALDDHSDAPLRATLLPLGTTLGGVINHMGDEDWFEVQLNGGSWYYFRTDTSGDTTLALVDSQGTQIDFNDDEDVFSGLTNSVLNTRAPTSGTYYLVVAGFGGQATPTYTLTAR